MREGDVLILTKPIGTGTIFAADMRMEAKADWVANAIHWMKISNRIAALCLAEHKATSCTDVTGFGLLGHLVEMVDASGVNATVNLDAIPIIDGALECIQLGIFSSLQPSNLRLKRAIKNESEALGHPSYPLLFDPQTAGGLLASIPAENAEACLKELKSLGLSDAASLGKVTPKRHEQTGAAGSITCFC